MGNDLMIWLTAHGLNGHRVLQLVFASMVAVLFLQSGLDKLFNWQAEKEYLTGHFAKSILKGWVPIALPLITFIELGAGVCSAIGAITLLTGGSSLFGLLGMLFAVKAIFLLFLGQRVAKDYAGAASLVPYFLMCAAGLYVFTT